MMGRAVFKTACGVLVLTCAIGLVPQLSMADGSPVLVSEQADVPSDPVYELGRLTWAMLDAIEREHIAPPARKELLQIVVRVLAGLTDERAMNKAVAEFARCQNSEEFAELFRKRWVSERRMVNAIDGVNGVVDVETPFPISGRGNRSARGRRRRDSEQPQTGIPELQAELIGALQRKIGPVRLIPEKEYRVEQQISNNRYIGLGVTLQLPEGTPTFGTIVPGGPADRAGLKPGTTVHQIDGRSTHDMPVNTLVDWIRGPEGTELTLEITDPNSADRRTLTLNRGFVQQDSILTKYDSPLKNGILQAIGDESIGWIKLVSITGSTAHELRFADARVRSDGIQVLVLDFRAHSRTDNLHHASLVADSFLDSGTLWCAAKRGQTPVPQNADRAGLFRGIPLVIIVDERQTGSMACAVAAALQDAGRATIVGTSPGFDGRINTAEPLDGVPFALVMNTMKLTRARQDRRWPLVPDHPVVTSAAHQRPSTVALRQMQGQNFNMPSRQKTGGKEQIQAANKATASALKPQNGLRKKEASEQIIDPFLLDALRDGSVAAFKPSPSTKAETEEELALRVARELLAGLPSKEK